MDDRAIVAIAARQYGVVSAAQCRAAGLTARAVEGRVRTGAWHPLHRGVYGIGPRRVDPFPRYMAAVLACGLAAMLSLRSAAGLWLIRGHHHHRPDVTVDRKLGPRAAIAIHWTRSLPGRDRAVRAGIPTTSLARTLTDLATCLEPDGYELALQAAERIHKFDRDRLASSTHRSTTRGHLEPVFRRIVRELGLPEPDYNYPWRDYVLDVVWWEHDLVVEVDDWDTHGTRAAFRADRRRDRELTAAGLRVVRLTADDLTPRAVARELAAFGIVPH